MIIVRRPAALGFARNDVATIPPDIEEKESHATILVVDDNRDSALTIAKLLQFSGHSAISAFSAREAVDLLDERPIDLVLSDIRMPDVDGFDLLRVLRHRFPALPIILMSGLPITSDDVVPAGASILKKPFTIVDLQSVLRQKLPRSTGT
jgi:CheY-like chemotaxis protein